MSTLVEALSVVIPRHVLDAGYPGGTQGYLDTARVARGARYAICDERLACVSFASPADADAFTAPLSGLGLGAEDGAPPPIACLDEDFGPTAPCPWLRWRRHDDGFTSCWLEWTEPGELATPTGWLPPRQRSAVARATARPHSTAPSPAAVALDPPSPLRVAPTTIGPLTPIGSPAILAALAGSPSTNGHGRADGDFRELAGLVAISERSPSGPLDEADSTAHADDEDGPDADAAVGERWALPEFEPTDMAASTDVASVDVASVDVAGADVAGADEERGDDADHDVVEHDDVEYDEIDAMIAELPGDVPGETTTEPAGESGYDWLTGPADPSSAVGEPASRAASEPVIAASAALGDETAYGSADADDDRSASAGEPTVGAAHDFHDAWRPVAEEAAAMDSPLDEDVVGATDAVDHSPGAVADLYPDDETVAALASDWSDVFEVARAAVGTIADGADPATDVRPSHVTDSDVEALFEGGAVVAATDPEPSPAVASPEPPVEHSNGTAAASLPVVPTSAPLSPTAMTAVDTAAPATTGPSLDAVRAHLAERGWRYSQDTDQGALFYQTVGGRASYPGFAAADESAQLVWLYTQIPVRVPEHRRAAAVELLTRANHGLAVGNFEFDYTDGEVRFKTVADTADGCFSAAAAGRLLRHSLESCDRYHDALMQVIYGGLSAAEAVR